MDSPSRAMALDMNRKLSEWITLKNKCSWITLLLLLIIILMELYALSIHKYLRRKI